MDKSIITNTVALLVFIIGYVLGQPIVLSVGLFAVSGAMTNWLAVYMLFEKVPGLYGSGVIPARFEEFKLAIQSLMMEQFFNDENIDHFIQNSTSSVAKISLGPLIDHIDLTPSFEALVEVIKGSTFGPMLGMVGGEAALVPMKEPFIEKMKVTMTNMVQSESFVESLQHGTSGDKNHNEIKHNIQAIVDKRLAELTPQLVKEIIQEMIKKHLGWLVVWGGVFGGLIGLIAAFI
ncbi:MAG: uncharacterized membrane protein YheB (UPF0754 family) [Alteromonadaceae bacterium]|jgi:uncharacterized membrane protein YheB (UPF0754 family)